MSEDFCHRLIQARIIIIYLVLIMLFASCSNGKQETGDEMPQLYPHPLKVKLNPEGGYAVNPLTGDSTQPIINSFGDTLKTGVNLPVSAHIVDPGTQLKPLTIPAGRPKVIPVSQNVHIIPENHPVIPVNKDSLKTFIPGKDIFQPCNLRICNLRPVICESVICESVICESDESSIL